MHVAHSGADEQDTTECTPYGAADVPRTDCRKLSLLQPPSSVGPFTLAPGPRPAHHDAALIIRQVRRVQRVEATGDGFAGLEDLCRMSGDEAQIVFAGHAPVKPPQNFDAERASSAHASPRRAVVVCGGPLRAHASVHNRRKRVARPQRLHGLRPPRVVLHCRDDDRPPAGTGRAEAGRSGANEWARLQITCSWNLERGVCARAREGNNRLAPVDSANHVVGNKHDRRHEDEQDARCGRGVVGRAAVC